MKDVMVSIRMPPALVEELTSLIEEEHYLDLSETIRAIVRKNWMQMQNPELTEIKALRDDISSEIAKRSAKRIQQDVAEELRKIRDQIGGGGK